ncbi:MAG TPA: hypothetical protein VGH73_09460 [Thermoanaerobaculia bacterium]|jgi:hypothetical protein
MKKNKVVNVSELDVQPISDEDLQAFVGQEAAGGSTIECCNGSSYYIIRYCDQA